MSRYELVIFDCDGVLVDSERITNQVFADMLNELGLPLTLDDMFEQFVGHSMAQCLDKIATMLGQPVPVDFETHYRQRTSTALTGQLQSVDGVEAMLAQLSLPYCVASNGDHHKMRTTLGLTGLLPHFDHRLFSATEVAAPKPAPDVFLYAASRLGVAPARCVVVEDTPTGVLAARAAGMTVLGYAGLTPAHRLQAAGAHGVFERMDDLLPLLH